MGVVASPALLGGCSTLRHLEFCPSCINPFKKTKTLDHKLDSGNEDLAETQAAPSLPSGSQVSIEEFVRDERARSRYFSQDFPSDIFFEGEKLESLKILTNKFKLVQKHVGFGNFNLLGMDDFFRFSSVTSQEKKFLEELFYFDAKKYGFNGEKVLSGFTDSVKKGQAYKVPYTGHYLLTGPSLELYEKIRKDVGTSLVLTSGVRGIAKQFHLFFEKGLSVNGNMSKASRSLAPAGYSHHGAGDFDVGKVGYGIKNFNEDFAFTDEYKRLIDLGYVNIRYTQDNRLGVRFEPWHIKSPT